MNNLSSENTRLRKELKANQTAYAKLNKEKDEAIKSLKLAKEKIAELESLLKLKEQVLIEVRQEKQREVAELVKIKNDLEMRLSSAIEADTDGMFEIEYQKQLDFTSQGYWTQSGGQSQLSCSKAIEVLKEWEGVAELTEQLKVLMKEQENDTKRWRPGTPLNINWKPHVKVFVSVDMYNVLELLQMEVFPLLEAFCKKVGVSVSFFTVNSEQLEEYSLPKTIVSDLSLQEVKSSGLFLGVIGSNVSDLCKSQVEHGFLNNPNARPSLFLFIDDHVLDVGANKLKQRIRNSSSFTTIIECTRITMDTLNECYSSIETTLKLSYNMFESPSTNQKHTFTHLSLLADLRMEYEQRDILESILRDVPSNPVCVDVTFKNLQAYMAEQATAVAPFLITAPTGSGKSLVLAKWIDYLQKNNHDGVSVFYHFVTHSCSSSSESCLMYRRFCQKLMLLYDQDSEGASLAIDPDSLEEVFSELLNKAPAVMEQSNMIFFIIDNAELLQDHSQLGWLHKPLPKNVRVVMTVNESSQYPDSWKHLASCTLPTPTSTDLQEVLPGISYGPAKKKLTEDQIIELMIISQSSFLWCVMAAKFILSSKNEISETELEDILPEMEEATEVPELAKMIVDKLEATYPSLTIAIEQILQLIYWSRNGLVISELQQLLQFPDVVVCFIVNELKNSHILWEINGILTFTHETVLEVLQFKYHFDSQPEDLLIWPETLIRFFSDLKGQNLFRCTEELPWLLKRGEFQQDLANVLLNIDILIQLYCSGQGGLLLKYWRWIGTIKDSIPEQYKVELSAVEAEASNDETSLMYVAMVMLTVGKILRNLGLLDETQPLLQRSLELYESHCEPDSEKVANALCELALLYTLMKKYRAAECFYDQALEIYEHIYSECSDQAINVLEALKRIYQETKRPELLDGISERLISLRDQMKRIKPTALTILQKHVAALEKQLNTFGEDKIPDAECVKCLNELATVNGAFGQESAADELFHTALNTSEDVLGSNHSMTLCILRNWTTLHRKMNKIEDAIILQVRIIEIKEKIGEEKDVSFAAALNNLANLLCLNGKYMNAIVVYDRAIEVYRGLYGHKHPKIEETIHNRELASQKCTVQSF